MIIQSTLYVIHISLPTGFASYLAFIQLILDGTEAGIPWHLVRDNKEFACFKPLLENIFVDRAYQHQSNEFSVTEVCFRTPQSNDVRSGGLPSAIQTSDICVAFVVIASIIANAERNAANIRSFGFH